MEGILKQFNDLVWGVPALILILGVGLYLSMRTGFCQLRLLPRALNSFWGKLFSGKDSQGASQFQALCTALAATVGTGNLAGVAGALAIGGPGAIFWMWVSALFGMVTKLAEAALAIRYRDKNPDGSFSGGPMYMIERGLGRAWKPLALAYAAFGLVAAFGVGNCTQINAVITGMRSVMDAFGVSSAGEWDLCVGIALAVLITAMLFGGAKSIGKAAEKLVPFAAVLYIALGTGVLILRFDRLPGAISRILLGAFSPQAVTGGFIGSMASTLRIGISRGVFTNEAGMGTASIAHAGARVEHPVEQGLMGIVEVFLDTVVICTLTALVILCSGVPIPYGIDEGLKLTTDAFCAVYGNWAAPLIALETALFAVATVLGWGLYGARCAQYLFGSGSWKPFAALEGVCVILGAVVHTETAWLLSDTVNGLMAIPNLIALFLLSPELLRLLRQYEKEDGLPSG